MQLEYYTRVDMSIIHIVITAYLNIKSTTLLIFASSEQLKVYLYLLGDDDLFSARTLVTHDSSNSLKAPVEKGG